MDHRPEPPRSTPGVGHRRRRPIRPLQHPRSTPDHVGRAAESIGGSAAPAGRLLLPPSGGHPAERLGPRGDRHPDEVIAGLAGRQQGVVSRRQLLAAGVSPEMIRHRRGRGRLHDLRPPIRGVYLVGHAVEAPLARERAALLACAPQPVVLSHRSAAVAWGIADPMPGPVDVTVIGPRAPRTGPRRWWPSSLRSSPSLSGTRRSTSGCGAPPATPRIDSAMRRGRRVPERSGRGPRIDSAAGRPGRASRPAGRAGNRRPGPRSG